MTSFDKQASLWQQRTNQHLIIELSNALYERELKRYSQDSTISLSLLQKRLASLPYYIKKTAEQIVDLYAPLDLDSQNGSWYGTQSTKPYSVKADNTKTQQFFIQHAKMALVVPVAIEHYGIEQIVLDSIDEIDHQQQTLHCNEQGWFNFDGSVLEPTHLYKKHLIKPSKPVMVAACCGHQWLNHKKTTPRLLSLREMLLATRINWRRFSELTALKK